MFHRTRAATKVVGCLATLLEILLPYSETLDCLSSVYSGRIMPKFNQGARVTADEWSSQLLQREAVTGNISLCCLFVSPEMLS